MSTFYSPLRYPGGKNKLAAFIARICIDNKIDGHYIEPYAGGAAVALFLLIEGFVNRITINDKDRSIFAIWHSILNNPADLCQMIIDTNVNVENWHLQREVQKNKCDADLLELGFSTLFMNRANRSGIINGGIMGGLNQTGNYKIDCRFNKEDLINRIKEIAKYEKQISLYNEDAIDLINKIESESQNGNIICYFDPPYYQKASSLYMNHYNDDDHLALSKRIQQLDTVSWVVSYDNVPNIQKFYEDFDKKEYMFKYTAYETRMGKEILFFSNGLNQPTIKSWNPLNFKLSKIKNKSEIIYKDR